VSTDHTKDFTKMVTDAGLPLTEAQARALWNGEASSASSPFNNNSDYSPFWRAVLALVTAPVLWLVNQLLIKELLPNSFLKTASSVFLDLFGWAVDCERKGSASAQGVLTFSRVVTAGIVEIPIGTLVQSTNINGKVYSLKTTAPAAMNDGAATVQVQAVAVAAGGGYNLASGYYAIMPTPIAGVDAVVNGEGWLLVAGADKEADNDYRLRIRNQFTAVNQYHTDAVYTKIITSFANINTRNVFFEHGAPRGPGTANAYILLDTGEPSGALLNDIQAHVMDNGNHGHGDDLLLLAMPATTHDLTVTVVPVSFAGEDEKAELVADVENAVRAAFRENLQYPMTTAEPFDVFSFSRMGGELHSLFLLLDSVHFDLDDIETGMNVPRLNSVTVVLDD
jgi:uncharacterized phage protein gp47/JayE